MILTVVGARPQFIKASVVSRALTAIGGPREVLVHTGQHYDDAMSAVFFRELDLPEPDYNLGVGSASHAAQTGRMMLALDELLSRLHPRVVLVYGDTNSTLAGALAAAKQRIDVVHVEAGLRSFNRQMPEEINRVVTDHLSALLLVPTQTAIDNLRQEGIVGPQVRLVGDVMYDAALKFGVTAQSRTILNDLGIAQGEYVLATIHRAENTDERARLEAIFSGLAAAARRLPVVVPLHPRTRLALAALGFADASPGLKLIGPVGYLDMIALERGARLIVTDSGGVQKEAYFHRVPCLTLRDETEWTELVALGCNRLVTPGSAAAICAAIEAVVASPPVWTSDANLYGGGRAAEEVAKAVSQYAG